MKNGCVRDLSQRGQGTVQYALGIIAVIIIILAVLFSKTNSPLGKGVNAAYNKLFNATAGIPTSIGPGGS